MAAGRSGSGRSRPGATAAAALVAGGLLCCVSPFLAWTEGESPANAFAALGPTYHPASALPEWLGAIPLVFGLAAVAAGLAFARRPASWRTPAGLLALATVFVPFVWSLSYLEAYDHPTLGPVAVGVVVSLIGEGLVVAGGAAAYFTAGGGGAGSAGRSEVEPDVERRG